MEGTRESRSTASTVASFLERIAVMFDRLRAANALDRLRRGDASLWTSADEAQWLGWLDLPERSLRALPALEELVAAARSDGIDRVVVLGMGGSSLGAEALVRCGPRVALDIAELVLLDTTDPDRVADAEAALRGHQPLFVCSSKSGTTLETALLQAYWLERYDAASFVAVTDPGTQLENEARAKGFRAVLPGDREVGGRFSVLSAFGLLPAALCGIGVREVLDAAVRARDSVFGGGSDGERRVEGLAALLGAAATTGRDKLTVLAPQHLRSFGWWLEQLLAESLGKNGRGVVPVLDEDYAPAARYRPDRAFLWLDDEGDPRSAAERERLAAAGRELVAAGQPVERLPIDTRDLGAELYRWEVVTALAGHLLAVHPFDQPDVEAAKVATRRYVEALRRGEALPRAASVTAGAVELSGYGGGTGEAEGGGGKVAPSSAASAVAGLLAAAR
ncbi:MAG TPA: transaldolase, partial [Thermoanaerobaculia bacterium]|nr:transaldolase [Thermoanaerobaculia bacterium]